MSFPGFGICVHRILTLKTGDLLVVKIIGAVLETCIQMYTETYKKTHCSYYIIRLKCKYQYMFHYAYCMIKIISITLNYCFMKQYAITSKLYYLKYVIMIFKFYILIRIPFKFRLTYSYDRFSFLNNFEACLKNNIPQFQNYNM